MPLDVYPAQMAASEISARVQVMSQRCSFSLGSVAFWFTSCVHISPKMLALLFAFSRI